MCETVKHVWVYAYEKKMLHYCLEIRFEKRRTNNEASIMSITEMMRRRLEWFRQVCQRLGEQMK